MSIQMPSTGTEHPAEHRASLGVLNASDLENWLSKQWMTQMQTMSMTQTNAAAWSKPTAPPVPADDTGEALDWVSDLP